MSGHDDRLVILAIVALLVGVLLPAILPALLQTYLIIGLLVVVGVTAIISFIWERLPSRRKH